MRKKQILLFYLCLLFVLTNHSTAQQSKKVTCTGKVIDEQGRPVAGAKVAAYEMQFDGIAGNFMLRKADEVTTTENGAFLFKSEPKPERSTFHDCKIVAIKEGLALGWTIWNMREDAESNIQLGESKGLAGIIVDEAGKPIVGADVRASLYRTVKTLVGKEEREWLPGIAPLQELGAQTDTQGKFHFNNITTEVGVDLLVTAPGKAIIYTYQSEISEPAFKAEQTDIKVILPAEARIKGRITDPDTGKGIAGTRFAVVATSSGLFYYRFVHTTNDDGTFNIGGLQTGQYLLRNGGFAHTLVDVESGKTTNINVQAEKLPDQPRITGIVRDEQRNPLKDVKLSIWPMGLQDVKSTAEGKFEISWDPERLPGSQSGSFYLIVRDKEKNLAAAMEIDQETKSLDIKLQPGVIITGQAVDPNNHAIEGAEIRVYLYALNIGAPIVRDSSKTNAEGNFEIKAIPTEQRYRIYGRAEGYGVKNMEIDIYKAVDNRLDVGTIKLPVANLTVTGVVVDVNDRPVSNVRIVSYGDNQPNQNTQTDAEGRFELKACEGRIRISANSSGRTRLYSRIETEGGASDVKIVISESPTTRYVPKQPPSLVGKSLPDLKGLGIELPPDDITDKMVLVCFFDMEQRPSRNCLMQLTKMVQELAAKDVVVVAIQALKIDKSLLEEWIKENDISFPVGMIRSNEEKTRFTWGVKSLPWLILTDKEHVVRAEGFMINELDTKIKKASK